MSKSCCFSHHSYLHTTPPQRVFFERDHESPSRREKKTNGCAYHFLAFAQKEVVDRNAFLSVRSEIIPKGSSIKNESATCLFKKVISSTFFATHEALASVIHDLGGFKFCSIGEMIGCSK